MYFFNHERDVPVLATEKIGYALKKRDFIKGERFKKNIERKIN